VAASAPSAPVSVIIPVYQGERYLGEALESVLAQTRAPEEVIVIDDGSTDGTAVVAASFGSRVTLVRQPNRGTAVARNVGIDRATRPFVAFLDADDVATPERLERQLELLDRDSPPDLVFGRMEQFISPELPPSVAERLHCDARAQPSPLPSCMTATRRACRRLGPMRSDIDATFVDWYMRALDLGLVVEFADVVVARRRIHGANQSYRNDTLKREYLRVIKASLDRRRAAKGER
jgi:glycosyltransferase involved in cell wall biosynthesis